MDCTGQYSDAVRVITANEQGLRNGTLGKYVVTMSIADLKEIANGELRAYSEELEHENSALQAKMDKAVEALKFYANADVYEYYDKYESTAAQHDGGEWARKVLKEIEE